MTLAIRTITRLQDADDAPSLGAGQDGYALTWDNASSAFVATEVAAGGLLATGATTGATSQAQAFTNGIIGPSWKPSADSTTALQLQNATGTPVVTVDTSNKRLSLPFGAMYSGSSQMMLFNAALGNLFLGTSGNVSVSGTNNTGFGDLALTSLSSGWNNFAAGYAALYSTTSGNNNFALGLLSMANSTADNSVGVGNYSGYVTGTNGIFIGYFAGKYETGDRRLHIDSLDRTDQATGRVSSLLYGEIDSTPANQLLRANGVFQSLMTDAVTNAVTTQLKISHDTSGTPSSGFGAGQLFELQSSTTAAQSAARIQALWNDATHATRKADLVLTAYDTAEREGLRIRGAGSAAAIGFLGATPAAQVAHVADAKTDYGAGDLDTEGEVITAINTLNGTINSILATLETFGLHAAS